MGGDGRCSCSFGNPTGCGSPPPQFDDSAHCATIVLARLGDMDGVCLDPNQGCVNGDYWLDLNVFGPAADPDPVLLLQAQYDAWRAALAGIPDHVLSSIEVPVERLPADGVTTTQVVVQLVDIEGVPLASSAGLDLEIQELSAGGPYVTVGPVQDLGSGRLGFDLTAASAAGASSLQLTVTGGTRPVRLTQEVDLLLDPVTPLHVGSDAIYAYDSSAVPFVLNLGAGQAGLGYRVLGSASGTDPGTPWDGGTLPLNADRFFGWTLSDRGFFQGSTGLLDPTGRAQAVLQVPPGLLLPFVGDDLDFCAVIDTDPDSFTNVVGFTVLP